MKLEKETVLGGQAVIEGVMMKGGDFFAVAVRNPSGDIITKTFSHRQGKFTGFLRNALFIRGLLILFSMLVIGLKALNFSATIALEEEENSSSPIAMGITVVVALLLAVLLFFVVPFFAGLFLTKALHLTVGGVWFNLFEGLVRIVVFLLYVWSITISKEIRRVFAYHGAEHKVVNAYESGAELTPETVMGYSRLHPRCGTSFILFVLLISIIIFSLIPGNHSVLYKGLMRLLLLPVVAGLSYELIRLAGEKQNSFLFRTISYPGMLFQKVTTREPDTEQVEVALFSLKKLEDSLV